MISNKSFKKLVVYFTMSFFIFLANYFGIEVIGFFYAQNGNFLYRKIVHNVEMLNFLKIFSNFLQKSSQLISEGQNFNPVTTEYTFVRYVTCIGET